MDSVKIQDCFATMNKVVTSAEKLKLIYEWVKTSHINLAEFQFLLHDLAMDLINKSASTR